MEINRLERYWLIAVAATLGAFVAATVMAVTVFGIRLPRPVGTINPADLSNTEFASPGVRQVGDGQYEAYIIAKSWAFDAGPEAGTPPVIRLPAGSTVDFNVISTDVMHGFQIEKHSINLELVPGQIAQASANFNRPGTYRIICNHYCGAGHQVMYATVVVE
jgi:cytochrome c oxidase subunit 2